MPRLIRPLLAVAAAFVWFAAAAPADAAGEADTPPRQSWSFSGPFGMFDRAQLQRGFRVYKEVCASCHALSLVSFRNLMQPGGPEFSEAQVRALAAEYQIKDGPNEAGEMFERPGRPSDRFPSPFPNEQAARNAMSGAYPPDLSVIAKARTYKRGFPAFLADPVILYQEHGVDYLHALLTGYSDPPAGFELQDGQAYNRFMPGRRIAMQAPLTEGSITYTDGTPQTVDQYARDVVAFLMWTAEPKLEERKRTGMRVMIFLIVFAGLLYAVKKKVWAGVKTDPVRA
jgi:ubiquinol-cytochrome c reductase cytochrome b/c1 subunit